MKIAIIVINILLIIALIPTLMAAIMSPMIFDAGVTTRRYWAAGTIVAMPFVIIIAEIVSWIAFFKGNYELALKASLSPLVFAVFLVFFLLRVD